MSSYPISHRFYVKVSSVTLRFEQTCVFEWHSLDPVWTKPAFTKSPKGEIHPNQSKLELERNLAINALLQSDGALSARELRGWLESTVMSRGRVRRQG